MRVAFLTIIKPCGSSFLYSPKHLSRVRRIVRFLVHHRQLEYVYEVTEEPEILFGTVDGDWAGCARTRRSSSGGILCIQEAILLSWARTQTSPALSSMESEYRSLGPGIQEGVRAQNLASELSYPLRLQMQTDSMSAFSSA